MNSGHSTFYPFQVKRIIFSEREYNPSPSGHFGSDIAILVPEKPIQFSEQYVSPACLAWSKQSQYNPGEGVHGEVRERSLIM